jgi:hypothetical protein
LSCPDAIRPPKIGQSRFGTDARASENDEIFGLEHPLCQFLNPFFQTRHIQPLFLEKPDGETSSPGQEWASVFALPFYNFFTIL